MLYVLAETIRHLGIYIQPFMPGSAAKMLDLLAVPENARDFRHIGTHSALIGGAELIKPEPVFPRFMEADTSEMR